MRIAAPGALTRTVVVVIWLGIVAIKTAAAFLIEGEIGLRRIEDGKNDRCR